MWLTEAEFEDLLNHVRRTPVKSRGVNPEEKNRRDRRMVMHFIITNEIITIIIRLSLIVLLSGIIGFERELKNHSAGLRTHILVGVGSCLLMLMSLYGFESYLTLHPQVTRYEVLVQILEENIKSERFPTTPGLMQLVQTGDE
jgi:hypothetical protein